MKEKYCGLQTSFIYKTKLRSLKFLRIEHRFAQMEFHNPGTCEGESLNSFGCTDSKIDGSTSLLQPAKIVTKPVKTITTIKNTTCRCRQIYR